jgi:hypothetical protein
MSDKLLPEPSCPPELDPSFRPAALSRRALAKEIGKGISVVIALEQADGSVFHHRTSVLPEDHLAADAGLWRIERLTKFLLWSRGGYRVYFSGPAKIGKQLSDYYRDTKNGRFDADMMGNRIYEKPFEVVVCGSGDLPAPASTSALLGRNLEGCRIGFDLGASDRKAAAVMDGKVVFSEETEWGPSVQTDPQFHFDEIMHSLRRAAEHLPRVDAIGGSAAGVYVNNRVKVASLFRGVSKELFDSRVKDLFLEIKAAWNGIPFEVVNDGEVTALAGSMAIKDNSVLGIAMGSSEAGGYVDADGKITSWLNELAFTPIDYSPSAPADEWSGDTGCGVQYLSQQCVARLMPAAGISISADMHAADKLKHVQALIADGDERAAQIYRTIVGRVTSGEGGAILVEKAREALKTDFPELFEAITFHMPDEKDKRHGQAIAAASLPVVL